jgi:hypothetical protein
VVGQSLVQFAELPASVAKVVEQRLPLGGHVVAVGHHLNLAQGGQKVLFGCGVPENKRRLKDPCFSMKKFLKTHPPIKRKKNLFTLFAQHVPTLNWVLFRRFFTTLLNPHSEPEVSTETLNFLPKKTAVNSLIKNNDSGYSAT